MTCELNFFNEKRGDLLAVIDNGAELSFENSSEVTVFDADKFTEQRTIVEAPILVDSRRLQSRVWQLRRASYS